MLPAGQHVRDVYLGADGVLAAAGAGTLLIDSSTIDVETARAVARGRRQERPRHARRAGVRRRRRRAGRHAHLHGRRRRRRLRPRAADPGKDGQDHRARRRRRQRPGGEDLQQHDPRRVDDRGVGGVRAGGKARPRRAEALRHLVEVVRPMLVDDDLLPGAGSGADVARQPRLQGGLYRGDDAEGPQARPGRRQGRRRGNAARRRCRENLRRISSKPARGRAISPA